MCITVFLVSIERLGFSIGSLMNKLLEDLRHGLSGYHEDHVRRCQIAGKSLARVAAPAPSCPT